MTTKKAIIIGTLCAIGVTLTAYVIKKGINIKPKTISSAYADTTTDIDTEALSDGWNFTINPTYKADGTSDSNYYTQPNQIQETYQSLANTTWFITSFNNTISEKNINFTSANTNFSTIKVERASTRYGLWYDSTLAATYQAGTYNWLNTNYKTINITNGQDIENTTLINYLTSHANLTNGTTEKTRTNLINSKSNQKSTTYLGIEYSVANKKTFYNDKVKSEGLAYFKITSTGVTSQLFLEHAVFTTNIPNMYSTSKNRWPLYKATIKTSKMTSLNMNLDNVNNFEQQYTNISNKTNIYSGEYTWQTASDNTNWRNGTYSNEEGQRVFTFGHDTNVSSSNMRWTTSDNTYGPINTYSQRRTNYIAVYYSCEVSNYNPAPTDQDDNHWYQNLFTRIGYTTMIEGYGISSNPITPPDIEDGNFISLTGMILNILTLPFTFLTQAFDLTLWANTPWAFNIKNAIFVMIGIFTFLFIIKLFTRGFDSLGNFSDGWEKHKLTKEQRKLTKANRQKAEKKVNKDK